VNRDEKFVKSGEEGRIICAEGERRGVRDVMFIPGEGEEEVNEENEERRERGYSQDQVGSILATRLFPSLQYFRWSLP